MVTTKSKLHEKTWIYTLFALAILTSICGLVILLPHFLYGFPRGHSFWENYFWYLSFREQVFSGEIYPRWLFNYNDGLGTPVFYFYAPLPFYLLTFLSWILGDAVSALTILTMGHFCIVLFSGWTFYFFIRDYTGQFWSILGASLYMFLPYHYLDMEARCVIGESLAYIWIPFILTRLLASRSYDKHLLWAGVGYGGLIISHLPSALLAIPTIVIFAICNFPHQLVPSILRSLALGCIGLTISAIYLVPALSMQDYLPLAAWTSSYGSDFHPVSWLLGQTSPLPPFASIVYLALGTATAMAFMVVSLFYLIKKWNTGLKINERLTSLLWACITTLLLSWFLMSNLSKLIWEHMPHLSQVQFPWRIGVSVDLSCAIILAILAPEILRGILAKVSRFRRLAKVSSQLVSASAIVLCIFGIFSIYFPKTISSIDPKVPAPNPIEYRPKWMVESKQYLMEDQLEDLANPSLAPNIHQKGLHAWRDYVVPMPNIDPSRDLNHTESIRLLKEHVSQTTFAVQLDTSTTLRLKKLYFPHWQMNMDEFNTEINTYPDPQSGLLLCDLPAGQYTVELQRKLLIPEKLGLLVSVLSILLAIVYLIHLTRLASSTSQRAQHR